MRGSVGVLAGKRTSPLIAPQSLAVREVVQIEYDHKNDEQQREDGHACKLHSSRSGGPICGDEFSSPP